MLSTHGYVTLMTVITCQLFIDTLQYLHYRLKRPGQCCSVCTVSSLRRGFAFLIAKDSKCSLTWMTSYLPFNI
uniref:Uncharacterized protein n=1 Tax=Anguilla anguilla TaxID=7936 RepID=A0A0E9XIL4_ANGAN